MMAALALFPNPPLPWLRRASRVSRATLTDPYTDTERMTALLARLARGPDREAFADLYAFYAPRIRTYLRRLGADPAAAEDLAQEAMATVWHKASSYDSTLASAGTWIFTIARNLRVDALRRERRPQIDPEDPSLAPDTPQSPETVLTGTRAASALHEAVAALPPEQAHLVELSFFQDQPHSVIAAELGLPLGTVKSRLRLAIARVRKALGDEA
jgi:RNA polymerase sigma-70 factor (ECF subfamily)